MLRRGFPSVGKGRGLLHIFTLWLPGSLAAFFPGHISEAMHLSVWEFSNWSYKRTK
jgi:uncharacterized protein involved in response to NO